MSLESLLCGFALKDQQNGFGQADLLRHDLLHMKILNLVPLLSPSMLYVTLVRAHLQGIKRTLATHFGGALVGDVGTQKVLVL